MAVLQAQDSILPASPCLMTSTSRARHRRAHAPHLLTTAQLRGCASRLLTELEGACSRPLFAEVALCVEEMRRERLESFGAGGDEEESSTIVGQRQRRRRQKSEPMSPSCAGYGFSFSIYRTTDGRPAADILICLRIIPPCELGYSRPRRWPTYLANS